MGEPLRAQSGPFRRSGAERSVARGPISFFEGLRRLSDQVKFPVNPRTVLSGCMNEEFTMYFGEMFLIIADYR